MAPAPGDDDGSASEGRRVLRSVALPVLVGLLLLQASWILTLPPFRGTDEVDHAYRAAAVAGGQWVADSSTAVDGRGHLVRVPRSLVTAAGPVCSALPYMGPDNCRPVRADGAGKVLVASSASSYDPAYYLVVGTLARPFHGSAALYAMRVVSSLACAALVAAAAWATAVGARTRWPTLALAAAITPVVVYSTAIVAPNGVEMAAALLLWCSILALRRPAALPHTGALLVLAGAAATVLVTVRSIGPLWALLVVGTGALVLGPARVRSVVGRSSPRLVLAVLALPALATLLAVGWTMTAGRITLEPVSDHTPDPVRATLGQVPLWLLQGIAAFPRRLDPALPLVYVLVGLVVLALLAAGVRTAGTRLRWALVGVAVVSVAVPFAVTVRTIDATGAIWQGRYGAPYHVGLFLLAGTAMEAATWTTARWRRAVGLALVASALADVLSVVHVLHGELGTSPLRGDPAWVHVPSWAVVLLVGSAFAAWATLLRPHQPGEAVTAPPAAAATTPG